MGKGNDCSEKGVVMSRCKDCNDTGKITLFSSTVDCNCVLKSGSKSDLKHYTVTEVSSKPIPVTKWEDLEFVGVVKKYVETVGKLRNRKGINSGKY